MNTLRGVFLRIGLQTECGGGLERIPPPLFRSLCRAFSGSNRGITVKRAQGGEAYLYVKIKRIGDSVERIPVHHFFPFRCLGPHF